MLIDLHQRTKIHFPHSPDVGKLESEPAEMHLVGLWTFLERELQDQEEMGRISEEATNVS